MKKKYFLLIIVSFIFILGGCSKKSDNTTSDNNTSYTSSIDTESLFTERDLTQEVDISEATMYTLKDNENINITKEGTYVIEGNAKNVTITIDVSDEEKVQLVLNNLIISNDSNPCIYVKNADKVFVTTKGKITLSVTGTFESDEETNTDAVIFSKDDLVLNGTGTLNISSTDNGITSKDDLKITGGTININSTSDALEANNSVSIYDGNITINSKKDGVHAEYDEDDSVGSFYMTGGSLNITASDDGVHATTYLQIDGGTITINAREGLEATVVQINDGNISITASDDGINAGKKSTITTPLIEINGGSITIDMGQGDTDAVDSNGNIYINGGSLNITARSSFDYDGEAKYTGGTIIANGEETNTITNQMMGGTGGGRGNRRGW